MEKKYIKQTVLSLIACIVFTISSCNYNDVLGDPIKQDTLSHTCSLTGFVLDENSLPVDAWLTLNDHETGTGLMATSTTRSNGSAYSIYSFNIAVSGTYDVICGAGGYINDTTTITVDSVSTIIFHNIILKKDDKNVPTPENPSNPDIKDDINEKDMISDGNGTMYGFIISKCIEGNDLAKIKTELVTDNADAENIRLSALYSGRDVRLFDSGLVMMTGARVTSTSNSKSQKPFTLTFNLDEKMSKLSYVRYYDNNQGEWVAVDSKQEDGKLIVNTDLFGSYGIFVESEIRQVETKKDTVFYVNRFNSDIYAITLENVIYKYNIGADLYPSYGLDVLQALMVEYMAAKHGHVNEIVTATFDFQSLKLQYDHGYKAWGVQKKTLSIISSNGCTVECYNYGDISLFSFAYQYADHKGGGND